MAPQWQALILNDYEAVMPLPVRKKWGIQYLFQPAFFQQGGIYSPIPVSKETTEQFLKIVMNNFPYAEICMNHSNKIPQIQYLEATKRSNFILSLNKTKEEITGNFSESFIKNVLKAKKTGLIYEKSDNLSGVIALYRSLYSKRFPSVKKYDYENFEALGIDLQRKNAVIIRKVLNTAGELLAMILLFQDKNRLYNLMSCTTPKGRDSEANYFLFDKLIEEFCKSNKVLDLEGSDIPGIADFYIRMAPEPEPYPYIRYNRLPLLLRIFKK